MKQFWKKTLWAALLTAAFALSATGCGDDKQPASSTANSASSAAQAADSSTASEETGSSAETNVFQYEMNDDGTVSITGYQGMEAVLEVPSTVDNYVVSAISNHAFEANQNLTEVTLPEGLSEIGESAFMDCGSLTTVQIPETVAQIDRAAFAGCSALTSITLILFNNMIFNTFYSLFHKRIFFVLFILFAFTLSAILRSFQSFM